MADVSPEDLTAFVHAVAGRLEKGRREYGDSSFARPPTELARELQDEALDIAGWGLILWLRLRRLEETAGELERMLKEN